jgi:signal transduction histidine kinase
MSTVTTRAGGVFLTRRQRTGAYATALALLVIVSVAFSITSWQRAVERHDRELQTMVVMGSQAVDTYLVTLEKSLARLGGSIQSAGLGTDTQRLLAEFKQRFREFETVVVIRTDGETLAVSEGAPEDKRPNVGQLPSFIDARDRLMRGESMVVSQPFFGPRTHVWLTSLRYGVRDAGGKLQFIIGAGLPLARTHAFWQEAPLPAEAAMGLLRDDMYIVARYPLPRNRAESLFTEPANGLLATHLRENAFPARGMVRGRSAFIAGDATVVFRRLPDYPLTFFVSNPERNIRDDWWSATWQTYLLILVLFGGGVAIIRWLGIHQTAWEAERATRVAQLEEITRRLEASNAELEKANGELEAFTYTVSHDLRAPIRAIDGFSDLLQDELQAAEGSHAHELLRRVRASVTRMSDLIAGLLEFSRFSKQALITQKIDMAAKVRGVVGDLDAGARVRFEIGALPACHGDQILMRQVWINLIGNAIKYSARTAEPVVRIGFENGEYFVADNGIGFDMAYTDKLFAVFTRLHQARDFPGTGVGLAIVRRIVERHGGRVRAEGAVGAGARFCFTIPAPPGRAGRVPHRPAGP